MTFVRQYPNNARVFEGCGTRHPILVRIGVAATLLGVCTRTLMRWEGAGRLIPACWTEGGHRRYETSEILPKNDVQGEGVTARTGGGCKFRAVAYARVSSAKQRDDLQRQIVLLEEEGQSRGYALEHVYSDIGSGLNDGRAGLGRLIDRVCAGGVDRVLVATPDRLARFGTRALVRTFKIHGADFEVVTPQLAGEDEANARLVQDVLALMTSYTGKLHRMRRGRGKNAGVEKIGDNPELETTR